jgi:hypothetical protein
MVTLKATKRTIDFAWEKRHFSTVSSPGLLHLQVYLLIKENHKFPGKLSVLE